MDLQHFTEQFSKFLPIVYKAKQRYKLHLWDLEDYIQEGMIIFFELLSENYPESVLPTYFKVRFNQHLINMLRKEKAFKRTYDGENYLELNIIENLVADKEAGLDNHLLMTDTLSSFSKQLKKNDQKILLKLINGKKEVTRVQKHRMKQKLLQFLYQDE